MWVYFIQNAASLVVKVGLSAEPEKRRAELQTAVADDLVLLGAIPGDRAFEAELHQRFRHFHIRGEWFRGDPEFLDVVENLIRDGRGILGTVWDECLRRNKCRNGLGGVEVSTTDHVAFRAISWSFWDRDSRLVLALDDGARVPADRCYLRSPWPVVCCRPTVSHTRSSRGRVCP